MRETNNIIFLFIQKIKILTFNLKFTLGFFFIVVIFQPLFFIVKNTHIKVVFINYFLFTNTLCRFAFPSNILNNGLQKCFLVDRGSISYYDSVLL